MPLTAALVIGGVNALGKGVLGGVQIAQANKLKKEAGARPLYSIREEYLNNQSLAENMAQSGMSQESKDYYTSNSDRGLSAGISATLQAGGGANSIQAIYDTYDTNLLKLTAADAEMQNENLKYLMAINKDKAGQENIKWSLNELDPWKDKIQASNDSRSSGFKNVAGALSDAAGAASAYATGKNYEELASNMGSNTKTTIIAPPSYAGSTISNPAIVSGESPAQIKAKEDLLKLYPNSPYLKNLYPPA